MVKSFQAFAVLGLGVCTATGLLLLSGRTKTPAQEATIQTGNIHQVEAAYQVTDTHQSEDTRQIEVALHSEEAHQLEEPHQSEDIHWGYGGVEGPEYWGRLTEEYQTCATGSQQSPIDLKTTVNANLDEIAFNYQPTPLDVVNNGHTIQVNYEPGSVLTLDGQDYELLHFHFHDPSEHTVEGHHHPMEAHLVHQNIETGDLAVVAVFLDVGEENDELQSIWRVLPEDAGLTTQVLDAQVDATNLLPTDTQDVYRYFGSLTTPPCSEIVYWIVMKQPVQVSPEQVTHFAAIVGENARPVQAISRRFVLD